MTRNFTARIDRAFAPMALATGIALCVAGAVNAAEMIAAAGNDADNTRINSRDEGAQTLTPLDQSNSSSDTAIVAKIRSSITDDKSLSTNAHNVKVIVRNGAVTLRGPVDNPTEKSRIEAITRSVAGVTSVQSELDIKH